MFKCSRVRPGSLFLFVLSEQKLPIKEDDKVAKTNYRFEKRKKELVKLKKKEEKRQRKLDKNNIQSKENPDQSPDDGEKK
jgi:hypothetical protein